MKTGLVIGKFMPLHRGHIALINFAAVQCERLIVLVCARAGEPIPGPLRLTWLEQTFPAPGKITIAYTDDPLPDAEESDRGVSGHWAAYLSGRFPRVDAIFSSEPYGAYLAEYMRITHVPFDPGRVRIPVSARQIREAPFTYWSFIPPAVRPYYRKKVCIYGPESTGKSTLTRDLACYFKTGHVPEIAREILGDRHVVYGDIALIAEKQAHAVLKQFDVTEQLLFCDTDLLTTRIYSHWYFRQVPEFPPWVEAAHSYDLYLFCDIDVPWVPDPQRDLGDKRLYFREWFLRELVTRGFPYVLISGSWEARFAHAVEAVKARWGIPGECRDAGEEKPRSGLQKEHIAGENDMFFLPLSRLFNSRRNI